MSANPDNILCKTLNLGSSPRGRRKVEADWDVEPVLQFAWHQ